MTTTRSSQAIADQPSSHAVLRLRQTALSLLLVVTAFHQSPGLIGNDTKLDLTADPQRFLNRALDLWNPSSAFGQLQNQAYGYLFPMGAFHLLGSWLGMPGWVVQRAWMALLLVTAFLGVLRLAARLDLGTPTTRLLGGLAFALSPRILTELGGNSSEILPMALLPWVLVPLVGPRAEQRPRAAAMRSGVAVLCMGAVNATAVLALLPLPALWLLPGLRHAAGRRLAAWWALAATLACTWWFVPLVLQARYTPNFLDYIETAATTTSTTSLSEVVRGTSHWLAYVATGGVPWWRSGWTLVTNSGVILNTGVLAALCVVGLLRHRMPGQGRLVATVALGLLAMSAAHAGPLAGPLGGAIRDLLDGPLAPFRNVHKFDPLVRLPLALGLCHLLSLATPGRARSTLAGLVSIALVGVSAPALAGQVVPAGAYQELPSWWRDTGAWLDDHDATGRSLVVPASGFGEYLWGRPLDNPLQALTRTPWAVRDAVPLGSPGMTRLLDAIEVRLDTGRGSAALASVLARSGVRYLVVSNDLDPSRTGAPRPVLVHQALADSPGIRLAASFGPQVGDNGSRRSVVADRGLDRLYPAVEVYEVAGTRSPVNALPRAATWVVSGGPESLFQLADRGLLGAEATMLAGDGSPGPSPRSVLTDALRRREVGFGSVRGNASATFTATQRLTRAQAVPDVLPVPGLQHLATAQLVGATAVSASSSASDAGALFDRGPEHQPFSAFDGDPQTAWVSGSVSGATAQWVQLDLAAPVDPAGTTVRLLYDDQVRGTVTAVRVRTDHGEVTTQLSRDQSAQAVAVPPGTTRHLRVTVDGVRGDGFGTLAGIREVTVPQVVVQETVRLPDDQPQASDPVVLLDRAVGARDGCVTTGGRSVCDPGLARSGEDVVRLDRTFALHTPATLPVSGVARPVAGTALDSLLDAGAQVQATASSRLVPDPADRPGAAVDGDPRTGWIAADSDRAPSLVLTWASPRTVDRLVLTTDGTLDAARPTRVEVVTPRGSTFATVPADGAVRFPSVSTTRLEVRFTSTETRRSFEPDGRVVKLPVGVSELSVQGLQDRLVAGTSRVVVPCGSAPPVAVDGVVHPTVALGTRDDLLHLRPMLLGLCDAPAGIPLAAGSHRVVAADGGGLRVEGLTLGNRLPSAAAPLRTTQVRRWDAEHRVVDVAAGGESYLVVHENFNRGWRAVLDGTVLMPARLDGWQQAWVVPAGAGGRVSLEFLPGRTFHRALLVGGLLVLLLLTLALWPARRDVRVAALAGDRRLPALLRYVGAVAVTVLLGGVVGVVAYVALLLALLVVRRVEVASRVDDALPALAGGALVLAGALTAFAPWNGSRTPAAFGTPVQVLALVALAAAAAALSAPRSSSGASAPEPAAPQDGG